MTISSAAGVAFADELGCELVVLARECSLKVDRKNPPDRCAVAPGSVRSWLRCASRTRVNVLRVEALGGRSANRGECAQACRMPYDLISDGHNVPLGDRRYLLSPQDLAGLDVLPDLVRSVSRIFEDRRPPQDS
jgi:putative protease